MTQVTGIMPGRLLTSAITLLFLVPVVLLPFIVLTGFWLDTDPAVWIDTILEPRVWQALLVTLKTTIITTFINLITGLLLAWVLVRYRFPGRNLINVLIDLPLALPTAVAGLALLSLYDQQGWVGRLFNHWNIELVYNQAGMVIGLVFITLPFVVRTLQPILESIEPEQEEAAQTLGALPFQRFLLIILPRLLPALVTGANLVFSRALGEYGAMVFLAGNILYESEYLTLLIVLRLDEFDYAGAASLALLLILLALGFFVISHVLLGGRMKRCRDVEIVDA